MDISRDLSSFISEKNLSEKKLWEKIKNKNLSEKFFGKKMKLSEFRYLNGI